MKQSTQRIQVPIYTKSSPSNCRCESDFIPKRYGSKGLIEKMGGSCQISDGKITMAGVLAFGNAWNMEGIVQVPNYVQFPY